jgi:bifunctional DNA-binding transcriptional regulator/antitoxin component of YhaV-PrlF toxin-antitoxin module
MSKVKRSWDIPVASGGRIVIPSEIRQELSMRDGQRIRMQLQDGILQIVPFSTILTDIQRRWAVSTDKNPTDSLIADRRAEAQKDQP